MSIKFQNIADFIDLAAAWGGNKMRAGEVVNVAQISSLQGTMKSNKKHKSRAKTAVVGNITCFKKY